MRNLLILFLSCVFFFTPPAMGQQKEKLILSLRQCEALALKNNPLLKSAELGLERSRYQQTQAVNAGILPKFELKNIWSTIPRARAEFTDTGVLTSPDTSTGFSDLRLLTEVDFSIVQPLFTFGKFSNLGKAASFGVDASQANIQKTESQIRLMTRQLYWGLLLGKELKIVIEDARREIQKAEDKLNEKLDDGDEDVSQEDLFKLQIFKYEVNKRRRETLKNISIAAAGLKAALGLAKNTQVELSTEYLEPLETPIDSLPNYLALAQQNRPELAQLQAGLGASRALINVSKSDYYPQIFLAGGLKYNYAQDRDDPNNPWVYNPTNFFRPGILLGFRLNLNFLQTRDKVRLGEAKYHELAYKEKLLVEKIKLDVQKKYLELIAAEKNIRESEKALKASKNWLRSVSMTFDLGLTEVKELIDAFKANSTMRGEHLKNIYQFNTKVAELSAAIGYDLYQ